MTWCNQIYCVDYRDALTRDVDLVWFKIKSQKGAVQAKKAKIEREPPRQLHGSHVLTIPITAQPV